MDASTLGDTQTHRIYLGKKKKKGQSKKRETTPSKMNICHGQLTSIGKYSDTNAGIKEKYKIIKIVITISIKTDHHQQLL